MANFSHILGPIKSRIIISESLLERGRHLGIPPPQFSLGMGDWEDSNDNEIDDLLLQAAKLADPEPALTNSDDDIKKSSGI